MRYLATAVTILVLTFAIGACGGDDDGGGSSSGGPSGSSSGGPSPGGPSTGGTISTPAALPNLRIADVRVEPKPVTQGSSVLVKGGQTYTFRFEAFNDGPGDLSGNVAVSVDWGCQVGPGSSGPLGQTGGTAFVGSLSIGVGEWSNPYDIKFPTAPGSCNLVFVVDPDDIYAETNETDNEWKAPVVLQ